MCICFIHFIPSPPNLSIASDVSHLGELMHLKNVHYFILLSSHFLSLSHPQPVSCHLYFLRVLSDILTHTFTELLSERKKKRESRKHDVSVCSSFFFLLSCSHSPNIKASSPSLLCIPWPSSVLCLCLLFSLCFLRSQLFISPVKQMHVHLLTDELDTVNFFILLSLSLFTYTVLLQYLPQC